VTKQFISLGLGVVAAILVSKINYRNWETWATLFMAFSLLLVILVFIPGIGHTAHGAARWINLGIFQLQPSEIVKLSFIIYLATWLKRKNRDLTSFSRGLVPFILLTAGLGSLIILQRDMGTLSIVVFTAAAMFMVAGASVAQIGVGALVGVLLFSFLIIIAPYRLQRLTVFLNPQSDTLGAGYHINQALIAVGSGGWWGRGFGQSLQKYLYLPEPHTDSIFAITVEELGFLRSLFVLLLIAALGYRGYQLAHKTGDDFGRLLAFGITSWFLFQAMINIAAILGLIPLTGLPLPFISYGGTSLIMSLVAVGIMINISKYSYGR
jgi:cell division protein FtsW